MQCISYIGGIMWPRFFVTIVNVNDGDGMDALET